MGDSDKALDNAVNTIEVFGKVFEVSATAALILKTVGIATLGVASFLTTGLFPVIFGSIVCATVIGKYAMDKLDEHKNPQNTQPKTDGIMKKLSDRLPAQHKSPSPEEIQDTLERSGDFGIFNKIAENLRTLGVVSKNKPINFLKRKELVQEKEISLPPK